MSSEVQVPNSAPPQAPTAPAAPAAPTSADDLLDRSFVYEEPAETPAPEAPRSDSAQPRDEQGRYATPDAARPPETPAPTTPPAEAPKPAQKVVKFRVDHGDVEVDLDAEYADEQRRAALAEKLRKGTAFDAVMPRERERGQQEAIAWFQSQGYTVSRDPQTGQMKVVAPQASQPAPAPAQDSPPRDLADLKARAREGDAEAIAALIEYTDSRATQAEKTARDLEAWRKQQEAAEAKRAEEARQYAYAQQVAAQVLPPLNALAEEFKGIPAIAGMIAELRATSAEQAGYGVPPERLVAQINAFGATLRGLRSATTPAAPAQQARPAASPPPFVPTGSGATSGGNQKPKPRTPDELLEESFNAFR